jgi:hypothetical protein
MNSKDLQERREALVAERDQLADRRAELTQQHAEAQRRWRDARIEALITDTPEPAQPEAMAIAQEAIAEADRRTTDLVTAVRQIDNQLKALVYEERRAATAALEHKIQPQLEGLATAARNALARYSAARLLSAGLDLDKADAGRAAELVRGDRGEWYAAVKTAAEELK